MAYTDYPNLAAPSFWDAGLSGIHGSPVGTTPANLAAALAQVTDTLASAWDGTKYTLPDFPGTGRILLVAPTLFDTLEIYLDVETQDGGTSPGITLYGTDGEPLPETEFQTGDPDGGDVVSGDRRIFEIMYESDPAPIYSPMVYSGVKALLITGVNDYPQGMPVFLYGLYGAGVSAETQFWTGFEGVSNVIWPFRKRMTEIF